MWHPGRPELAEEAHSTEGPKRADDAHRQDGRARESCDGQGDDKGVDNVVAVAEEGSQPAEETKTSRESRRATSL